MKNFIRKIILTTTISLLFINATLARNVSFSPPLEPYVAVYMIPGVGVETISRSTLYQCQMALNLVVGGNNAYVIQACHFDA